MAVIAITKIMSAMSTIQSPSPIEVAARNQSHMFIVYVAVLVIGGIAAAFMTVLVYRAGNRYQSAVQADADARIAESNAEAKRAGEGAAQANERAELANERAGQADERAAEANERAAVLENKIPN